MSLFFLTFFSLYSGLHYYLFTKVRDAFSLALPSRILLLSFLLLMVVSPFLVWFLEKHGYESLARMTAYVGYTWMGFAFLFFAGSVAIDGYRLILFLGSLILKKEIGVPSYALRFLIPFFFALAAGVYGHFEAWNIRTERVVVKSPKIPMDRGPLKIAQISDVHLGMIVREERLRRILQRVKMENPDIFISTGDLVDAQIDHLDGLTQLLQEIQPGLGKFAVTGNHEYYAGLRQALDFTRRAGFRLLRGEGVEIGGFLNLAGVDDPTGLSYGEEKVSERDLLAGLPRDKFTIFLKHRPVIDPESLGLFDLQISGHTHAGQIFPFVLLSRLFFPYNSGLFRLPSRAILYVSRGSGTWGPPIRFLAPPEVTIFEVHSGP
jgi:predicted MPP superfamily phosphohydrolase